MLLPHEEVKRPVYTVDAGGIHWHGDPNSFPWTDAKTGAQIGQAGLFIAALINEPSHGAPNALLTKSAYFAMPIVRLLRDVAEGEELTLDYGPRYDPRTGSGVE